MCSRSRFERALPQSRLDMCAFQSRFSRPSQPIRTGHGRTRTLAGARPHAPWLPARIPRRAPGRLEESTATHRYVSVHCAQRHMSVAHTLVWTLLSHPCRRTKAQDVQVEEDPEEPDDQDDEDNEDTEEDEEDKGDGGTHATPCCRRSSRDDEAPGRTKSLEKDKTRRTRRRRRRRRRRQPRRQEEETDAEYLPDTGKSEINETRTEDQRGGNTRVFPRACMYVRHIPYVASYWHLAWHCFAPPLASG